MLRQIRCALLVLLGVLASAAPAMSQSADFDVTQVASGVYAVIAKPGIASNGAFIVNNDDVVVVDTHLRPSWAREVIAEIKKITDKPVRYVINTHWHRDHVQGNQGVHRRVRAGRDHRIQQDFARQDQLKNQPVEIVTRAPEEIRAIGKIAVVSGKERKGRSSDPRMPGRNCSMASTCRRLTLRRFRRFSWCREISRSTARSCCTSRAAMFASTTTDTRTRAETPSSICPQRRSCLPATCSSPASRIMRSAYPVEWLSDARDRSTKLDWNIVIPGHGGVQRNRRGDRRIYCLPAGPGRRNETGRREEHDELTKRSRRSTSASIPRCPTMRIATRIAVVRRTYAEVGRVRSSD